MTIAGAFRITLRLQLQQENCIREIFFNLRKSFFLITFLIQFLITKLQVYHIFFQQILDRSFSHRFEIGITNWSYTTYHNSIMYWQ